MRPASCQLLYPAMRTVMGSPERDCERHTSRPTTVEHLNYSMTVLLLTNSDARSSYSVLEVQTSIVFINQQFAHHRQR